MLTSTTNKVQYSISYPFGTTFPVTFKYWLAAEIHAVLSFPIATEKADQELVLNVDFSLTAPGDTGTLTRLSDWDHDAERLTIYRLLGIDQQTDYRNGEAVDMDLLEQDFDRATARMQQLDEKSDRHLIIALTDPATDLSLPSVAERASKFLAFDAGAQPIALVPMDDAELTYIISRLLRIPDADPPMDMVLPANADRLNKWFAFDSGGLPIAVEGSADGYPVSDFMATVLDDNTAGAARDTLEIDSGIEIVGNLTMEARRRYIVTSKAEVTLPASAVIGDRIFLECAAYTKIKQSSADHVISWRDSLFTTKGINGYLQLMPGDSARFIYRGQGFAWQAPLKIANPATLPDGTAYGAAWSPDGRYLAVAHLATPFVTIYDWITGSPVKISDPATLPPAIGYGTAWSPDGRYLTVLHAGSPYLTIYDWITGSPVKISDPATLPTGIAYGAAWSPDGRYMAVSHTTTPFVTIYDWSTGSPVKIANPGTLPTGDAYYSPSWSPDGRYLSIPHATTPYLTIYDWITGSPVKIANPSTLPTGTGSGTTWSPDGRYMAVSHNTTPYVTIYDWITGSPVKISDPATLPYGNGQACAWSPDGRYLPIPSTTTSFMIIYQRTGRAIIKISDPATIPTGTGHSPAWSPDGRYLAVPHDTTPFLSIYDLRVSANNAWLVDIATRNGQVAGHQSELEYRFK